MKAGKWNTFGPINVGDSGGAVHRVLVAGVVVSEHLSFVHDFSQVGAFDETVSMDWEFVDFSGSVVLDSERTLA